MAILNTLLVNGNSVNGERTWTTQSYLNIDEGISSADGSIITDDSNGNVTEVTSFLLSSTDALFQDMLTLSWQIRYRVSGAQTNVRDLYIRIVDETTGAILAAQTSGGTYATVELGITSQTMSNSSVTAFAYVDTGASKASWDNARVEIQLIVDKVHGGDTNGIEVDTLEFTGTATFVPSPIVGTINGAATVSGTLTAKGSLVGESNGVATVDGALTAKGQLVGNIDGLATVSGAIINSAGVIHPDPINGVATVTGTLTAKGALESTVNGVATVDGDLIAAIDPIEGVINGVATVSGTLIGKKQIEGKSFPLGTPRSQEDQASWIQTSGSDNNRYCGVAIYDFNDIVEDCSFLLDGISTPGTAGTVQGEIWSLNPSSQLPISLLETSNNSYSTDDITSGWNWYNFDFDGNQYNGAHMLIARVNHPSTGTIGLALRVGGDILPNEEAVYSTDGVHSSPSAYEGTYKLNTSTQRVLGTLTAKGGLVGSSDVTYGAGLADPAVADALVKMHFDTAGYRGHAASDTTNSFTAFTFITSWKVFLKRVGSPDFQIKSRASDRLVAPNATEVGNPIEASSISTEGRWYEFNFAGAIDWSTSGPWTGDLALALEINEGTHVSSDASNYIEIKAYNSDQEPDNLVYHSRTSGGWASAGGDLAYYINDYTPSKFTNAKLTGKGALVGVINGLATVSGLLVTDALQGVINGLATVAGDLTDAASSVSPIEASINGVATTSGTLTGKGALIGVVNGVATVTAIIKSNGILAVVVNGLATVAGILTAKGTLQGIINGLATVNGIANARGDLASESNGVATVSGTLTAKGNLEGSADGVATLSGLLNSNLQGSVIVNGIGAAVGTLTGKGALIGVINGVATVSGILTAKGSLAGVINGWGSINVTTVISAKGSLSGESNGIATVDGILASNDILGAINGVATVTGVLTAKGSLVGESNGLATVNGLTSSDALAGSSDGVATVTGTLTSKGGLIGSSDGVATISPTLTGMGALAGISAPLPEFIDLGTGSLIAKFFTDDESYGETLNPKGKGVEYIDFYMGKIGTPDFEMQGEVWSMSGGLPDTLLQVSNNTIQATSVPTGPTYQRFNFDVIQNYYQEIAIVVHIIDHTVGDNSNYIERYYGDKNHFKKGQIVYNFTGLSWSTDADQDINGKIQLKKFTKLIGTSYGVVNGVATVSGTLTAKGSLVGVIDGVATVTGDLEADQDVVGQINGIATVSGTLTAKGSLEGTISGLATTQGTLVSDSIQGTINGVATVSGTLTAKGSLEGASNGVATVSGTLTSKGNLEGAINGITTVSGILTGKGSLAGIINGVATVQGILVSDAIQGTINGVATVSGTLTAKGQLVGVSNGLATTQGLINSIGVLGGASNGQAITQGVLTAKGSLAGVVSGLATLSGSLISDAMAGVINGTATTQGTLTAKGSLAGTSNGLAIVSGTLINVNIGNNPIEGVINGVATVSGTLTGKGSLSGIINGQAITQVTGILKYEMFGVSNGVATVTGNLTYISNPLVGASNGSAIVVGTLTAKGSLVGSILGTSSTSINTYFRKLAGQIFGVATVSGFLNAVTAMLGVINGQATVSGTLTAKNDKIYGESNGVAITTGTLTAKGSLSGVINGQAEVIGTLNNQPEPPIDSPTEVCTYRVTYNPNPTYTVTYNENPKFTVKIEKQKYVVTFNCQKIRKC